MAENKNVHLNVQRPFSGAIELCEFSSELTYFHNFLFCCAAETEVFDSVVAPMLRLANPLCTTAKLHSDHVLLLRPPGDKSGIVGSCHDWLAQRQFATASKMRWFRISTKSPIEDGFFTCICASHASSPAPKVFDTIDEDKWHELSMRSTKQVAHILVDFFAEEVKRIDGRGCMQFLDNLYPRMTPRSSRGKYVNLFDTESAFLEFAASVVSPTELRFWSRPVQYPK